jgi:hypothetical protein
MAISMEKHQTTNYNIMYKQNAIKQEGSSYERKRVQQAIYTDNKNQKQPKRKP